MLSRFDQILKRISLDYVDIFYHHRPDPNTPLEETMGALDQAVKSGKALYVGLSNYDGETMEKAAAILKDLKCPFVINQNSYSIYNRTIEDNGLKNSCKKTKKGLIIFSPLSQGLLTDRYLKGIPKNSRVATSGVFLKESNITPEVVEKSKKLNEIAQNRGQTLAQMALSWVVKNDEVTSVLIGASNPEQIKENCEIVNFAPFSDEEIALIDKIALS